MTRGGVTDRMTVDLAGAGFEAAILIGGIILGGYVDRTKEYKQVTMACLATTAFMCIPLGLTDHALGQEPALLVAALLGLGFAAGPVQPINAELAVDVTYPGDETAVESVQQIGGNLVSALLVPVAELLAKRDFNMFQGVKFLESDVRGDVLLLVSLALMTMLYFSSFDAPLARSLADLGGEMTSAGEVVKKGAAAEPQGEMLVNGKVGDASSDQQEITNGAAGAPNQEALVNGKDGKASEEEIVANGASLPTEEELLTGNVLAAASVPTGRPSIE